jgi:hypothetical protein
LQPVSKPMQVLGERYLNPILCSGAQRCTLEG